MSEQMTWQSNVDILRRAVADLACRVDALEQRQRAPWPLGLALDGAQCACGDAHVDTCQGCAAEPAPVPEWRRLVDLAAGRMDDWMLPTPLGTVLDIFSYLEMYPRRTGDIIQLARLVAVCEAQVGDEWKANDPARNDGISHSVWRLMNFVQTPYAGEHRPTDNAWRALANRAAAWLRDLTEDGAA